jgi:hypothetical protein
MALNRAEWLGTFYPLPGWLCPACEQGHLRLIDKTLAKADTAATLRGRKHPDWEHEWDQQRFSGLLQCDNAQCKEVCCISGTTSQVEVYEDCCEDGIERQCFVDGYDVRYIYPSPLPFRMSQKVPKEIADLLRRSTELYWADPEGAANKLRQAIEVLLTEQGVRRTIINRQHRRQTLNLHSRIVEYKGKQSEAADLLLAVKWIGNEGSHAGSLKHEDVLDGYEMLGHVLDDVYERTRTRLANLAKSINRNKGPTKKRR